MFEGRSPCSQADLTTVRLVYYASNGGSPGDEEAEETPVFRFSHKGKRRQKEALKFTVRKLLLLRFPVSTVVTAW